MAKKLWKRLPSPARGLIRRLRTFVRIRLVYRLRKVGRNPIFGPGCTIGPGRLLSAGDDVFVGPGCHITSDTILGDMVMLASRVAIVGGDHQIDQVGVPMRFTGKPAECPRVVIEDEAWVGHGAILVAPVRIGRGAVVAAGSVVTKDVEAYTIVGGVPARLIRPRFTAEQIAAHEKGVQEFLKRRIDDA